MSKHCDTTSISSLANCVEALVLGNVHANACYDIMNSCLEGQSPGGDEDQFEGSLIRKHEWESTTKKATNRSWDKIYVVLRNNLLMFYKDQKSYKAAPEAYYKNESPVDLRGGSTQVATDYTKKRHVFRIKLANGAEFLFQAKDDEEMAQWTSRVAVQCDLEGSGGPSRSQTLPASGDRKDEPKRRSFFTLKKKLHAAKPDTETRGCQFTLSLRELRHAFRYDCLL
uniref:PH domain-containing protein n=1 Tax=Timema genevievae TaxID=629358 RepID=A0A7R9JZB7_TIMGE|nr:unnamed protein product [Timema genevievae]